jgi:transposase InsO family protein
LLWLSPDHPGIEQQWRRFNEKTVAESMKRQRLVAKAARKFKATINSKHTLKVEAIHGERFPSREAMRQTVFEFIELEYNRTRLHSTHDFEVQQVA